MVLELYIKMTADVRQFRGANVPQPPGELHGTYIFVKRRPVAVHVATCMQDAPVEGCVVRGDKIHIVKKVLHGRPKISESGL